MQDRITDEAIINSFMNRIVQKSNAECWPWVGGIGSFNRGMMRAEGRQQHSYRISYRIFADVIEDGLVIRHKCDNPNCVNPQHLIKGTQQDNVDDIYARNRNNHKPSIGSNNGRAKLNEKDVRNIKYELKYGAMNQSEIAREYEVSPKLISMINAGALWKHVEIENGTD